jgi:histidinol phosphatase-like enzyme (inositol monophosphatase family)
MDHQEIKEHMAIARELAEEAGKISLEYFRKPQQVDDKMPGVYYDPVTEADKRIEEKLREGFAKHFPGYSILGEEYGSEGDNDLRWVIDPIDGTRAFISGVTGWGVLLGLTDGNQCLGGLMHQPFLRESFVADDQESWLHNDAGSLKLESRQDATLQDAIIYCTHPFMFGSDKERKGFNEISARCRMQRFGGDCYSYALIAHGCVDLVIEGMLQPYDIVPLVKVIESAGGKVTNLNGETPMEGGTVIAAANESLHAAAMELMQQCLEN